MGSPNLMCRSESVLTKCQLVAFFREDFCATPEVDTVNVSSCSLMTSALLCVISGCRGDLLTVSVPHETPCLVDGEVYRYGMEASNCR